ncbi:GAK system CofD-like protein [Puniceibacterium sp. IMCC21224]|uniref:GAK system CofD-like protein n=1 Tax=Puniceibacterium sp. IMCC21224 TaxID=1618204 RepID=UPI00064D8B2E|nr:GAK system CofD-like protein [Puniceibacterium sp. IMCC21224]KMK68834.1 CofD-related protein, GAK system [Puniceibacterium sp. IMCC21224]
MTSMHVERELRLPDDLRVARSQSAPHLGPRILFFSGGSALNGISRQLKHYTFNSMHLITPFDSGGSSQVLRRAFDMPAVGDLRSRLMALADESVLGQPDVYALFSYRLSKEAPQDKLRAEVARIITGNHPLISAIAKPMRQLIQSLLKSFADEVPDAFDYRNASIGNLILAGGYLSNGHALEPVLFLMSKMVDVRGTVRAIVDENLQLGVDLADGRRIISQRLISGKEAPPIDSPIVRCFLSDGESAMPSDLVPLPKRNRKLIEQADVICYPPGSLYSSVVANLLPAGVGKSITGRRLPKVYLPSLGQDPEALGHDLADQVSAIITPLRADAGPDVAPRQLMTHVLCDTTWSQSQCANVTKQHGIPCLRLPLGLADEPKYDPQKVARILVSLD